MNINKSTLVSICIIWDCESENSINMLHQLSEKLRQNYEYFEMIVVSTEQIINKLPNSTILLDNTRYVTFNEKADYYKMRSSAAYEAIGDLVVITSFEEMKSFDILKMLFLAKENDTIVKGWHNKLSIMERIISWPMIYLGQIAKYDINLKDARTVIYPRVFLNKILKSADLELAMRFLPTNLDFNILYFNAEQDAVRKSKDIGPRLSIIYSLALNMSPFILRIVSILCALLFPIALFYIFYVILVWATYENVQEGWTTLSLLGGAGLLFISLSMLGLSISLQYIITQIQKGSVNNETYDVKKLDIFKDNQSKLNIEVNSQD